MEFSSRGAYQFTQGLRDPFVQVGQGFLYLIHQHQTQVAGLQLLQGFINGQELTFDGFDVACARRAFEPLA